MGDFDFGSIVSVLPFLLKGLTYTIQLTVVAAIGGTLLGILLALARLSHLKWLSLLAAGYINLMRSIPLLLVIFWFYFLVPVMLQSITGSDYPPKIGAERSAYFTFILFEAAYFAEIVRAGIQSIPKGQLGAAYALGLTYAQSMRLIILPQALRNMLPVLLTQTIVLFQDVSLVALLNVTDFRRRRHENRAARQPRGRDVHLGGRGVFRAEFPAVARRQAPASAHRHRAVMR